MYIEIQFSRIISDFGPISGFLNGGLSVNDEGKELVEEEFVTCFEKQYLHFY
jgi:hypothetical protein